MLSPMRVRPLAAVLGLALALPGCQHRGPAPADTPRGLHGAPTAPETSYYDAPGDVPVAQSAETERTTRRWIRSKVILPARVPTELAHIPHAADPIELVHYRPTREAGRRRAAIVMSPILANSRLLVSRFAALFAEDGYHVLLVMRKDLEFDPAASFQRAEAETRLVVMRSKQAVDWLVTLPDVRGDRIGTFGISAGSIISTMLAGADPRLRTHLWMLGGGPLADVMGDTSEGRFERYRAATTAATGLQEAEVRRRMRTALRTDPVILAPRVQGRVLMILAAQDTSVPTRWGRALWVALGRPELRTTPFGHYTTFLLMPWLEEVARGHFRTYLRAD